MPQRAVTYTLSFFNTLERWPASPGDLSASSLLIRSGISGALAISSNVFIA